MVNAQFHDLEESKLNSTINANSDAHTLTHDKIIKSLFNTNNLATIKSKKNYKKDIITRVSQIGTIVTM